MLKAVLSRNRTIKVDCSFVFRYLALEGMCLLATSEFSHEAVKKHQETVITALKVNNSLNII